MSKLVEDLSKLTFINEPRLEHLGKIATACICEEFTETILAEKTIMDYDIEIGRLIIGIQNDEIKYKFIPSENLKNSLVSSLKGKRNSLEVKVEKSLVSCIENTYKDLL